MNLPTIFARRKGEFLFVGLLILSCAMFLLLGTWGLYSYRSYQINRDRLGEFKALQRNLGHTDSLTRFYQDIAMRMESLKKTFPTSGQGSMILQMLAEQAKTQGLQISDLQVMDVLSLPGSSEYPFALNVIGKFPDLLHFIAALENQDMILRIRKISIKSEAMHHSSIHVQLELSIFVPKD